VADWVSEPVGDAENVNDSVKDCVADSVAVCVAD